MKAGEPGWGPSSSGAPETAPPHFAPALRRADGVSGLPAAPGSSRRAVWRYREGVLTAATDEVAAEYALTIYVNDGELATLVCTPENLEDMVIGFLASEGVIRAAGELCELAVNRAGGSARARTAGGATVGQEFFNKRYIASCCGKSRQSFYFVNDAHTARFVDDPVVLAPGAVFRLLAEMETRAELFRRTGGAHIACLGDEGGVRAARADIGRHNALDKLFGHVLARGLPVRGHAIAFSGRLSSEVLLKVAKIGVGIVLAKGAPTALAIDMAEELGITAVGFARGGTFNVYAHPWRIRTPPDAV